MHGDGAVAGFVVELDEHDLFPCAQAEGAVLDGEGDVGPDEGGADVGVAVAVLPASLVPVVDAVPVAGEEPFERVGEVFLHEPGLVFERRDGAGAGEGVDEGLAGGDVGALHDLVDVVGEVEDLDLPFRGEGEVFCALSHAGAAAWWVVVFAGKGERGAFGGIVGASVVIATLLEAGGLAGVMASRARFATKAGFILSAIGSAVGLGNVWRFPQITSQNGGAAFLFLYVPLVLFVGIPLIWAELAAGQRGQGSAPESLKNTAGPKWQWVGILMVVTSTLFLGYYAVIAGLSLSYAAFAPTDIVMSDPAGFLAASEEGPRALLLLLLFMTITAGIVTFGVSNGIERANMIMMPALFAIIVGLAIYGLTRPGALSGVEFYLSLSPGDLDIRTVTIALGQVFFSSSVGFGIMITYGSYNEEGESMLGSSATVGIVNMLVGLVSGLMVFTLVFAEGLQESVIDPDAAMTTALFLTLPSAFSSIGGVLGHALMLIFFVMLTMAALSSSISGLEVIVSFLEDRFDVERWKLTLGAAEIAYGIGILSAFSVGFLGRIDAFVGSVMLILGGLGVCLLYTFGFDGEGERTRMLLGGEEDVGVWERRATSAVGSLVAYVLPVVLVVILLINLDDTCVSILHGTWAEGAMCDPIGRAMDGVVAVLSSWVP